MKRREFITLLGGAAAACARFAAPAIVGVLFAAQNVLLARAQEYPTRPVTLIAPVASRWGDRHSLPHSRAKALGSPRKARHHRESGGSGFGDRNRLGREICPRRIHARDGRRYGTRRGGHGLQEAGI